jgi:glucans biosynthesis protein
LLQREKDYEQYQDDEAKYHLRPSVWITPQGAWKNGQIELLELPGVHEGIDNIAAYWVPPTNGDSSLPTELAYRITYLKGDPPEHDWLGRATATEIVRRSESAIEFRVTFEGKALSDMAPNTPLVAEVKSIRGRVIDQNVLPAPKGRVVQLVVQPEGNGPVEIQARLKDANRAVSETWSYLCALTTPSYKFPQVYTRTE